MKPFTKIASILFGLIAAAHLARVIFGWEVTVNGNAIPMSASIVAVVITGLMSGMLCREGCCKTDCKPPAAGS